MIPSSISIDLCLGIAEARLDQWPSPGARHSKWGWGWGSSNLGGEWGEVEGGEGEGEGEAEDGDDTWPIDCKVFD